jgi:hypothetical protein
VKHGAWKTILIWAIALLAIAALGVYMSRRNRAAAPPLAVPLEVHHEKCAGPAPAGEPVACPWVGQSGAPSGVDYGAPFAGLPQIACRSAGPLVMPTGALTAHDPLVFMNDKPFTKTMRPGTYPVILAIHHDREVAAALLKVRDARPVRWEIAVLPGEAPGHHFYPVDSGTGCYVDASVARTIMAREAAELERQAAHAKAQGVSPSNKDAWDRAMDVAARDRKDLLGLFVDNGLQGPGQLANVCIDAETGGNIVAFSSGAGDGSYGVYVGYDATGEVAAFVTDFDVLEEP